MKKFLVASFLVLVSVGCHSQVPPSPVPTVTVSWTAATSCSINGAASCGYILSRAVVPSGSCPATTSTSYTPLNSTSPVSGTSYVDVTASSFVCYAVQTVQGGLISIASPPSNSGTPLSVPAVPTAPGAPNVTTTASLNMPSVNTAPAKTLASNTVFTKDMIPGDLIARVR